MYTRRRGTTPLLGSLGAAALLSLLLTGSAAANTDQVDFNKYELDSEVSDMMWCGKDNEATLVLTDKGSIYRSRDRGFTWKKLQSVMAKAGSDVADQEQEVCYKCYHGIPHVYLCRWGACVRCCRVR